MTVYGIDVASHQHGIDMAQVAREGFGFAMVKITEGDSYTNPDFHDQIDGAFNNGMAVCAYHALHLGNGDGQAAHCASQLGDASIPIMLDWESFGDNPDVATAEAFVNGVRARGFRATLLYLPEWYARGQGFVGQDLSGWGMALVNSNFPGGSGYASEIYPGDDAPQWGVVVCGMTPTFWQFTNQAAVAGMHVDSSAYRGNVADLAQWFKVAGTQVPDSTPAPAPIPAPVDRTQQIIASKPPWPAGFGPNDYLGDVNGPSNSHGGDPRYDGPDVIAAIKWAQQMLIIGGNVPGHTDPDDGWADGLYEQPTVDAVTAWQRRDWAAQTTRYGEIWSDDYSRLV